ncbi:MULTISPECIES: PEGA domain-containing protein [unclassified Methanoregula]|uniref:PEGA domain-containing protein n=1 Tax=unclassified Methanoregula TaxID=2649730 RepID=UPI0009C76ADE|nr:MULTISPECIES: PEGA domain-containing protein [unclassified Methanoregula]OPX61942.1 MAG: PEGA domain protein [Methanoregula sp. PtaB.Bin085]OPY34383.1 MAG: PEGA domain protein [Methanoregula sp. PtaU1.Bin006]
MPRIPAIPFITAVCLVLCGVFLSGCAENPRTLTPDTGSVRILSSPPGAEVYLNGEYRGTTPAAISGIPAGNYSLELRANGYDRWTSPVIIQRGGLANISATLDIIPGTSVPVTFTPAVTATALKGNPDIHIDGYWMYPPGTSGTTENMVPLLIHANGFNVGDADARVVTASANLYYGGRQICWKTVYFGTLKAGGHVITETMISCPLPSNLKSADLTIRFENIVISR